MPYWLQIVLSVLFWCAVGLMLRPLIHRHGGRND